MSLTRSDTLSTFRLDIKRYVGFMEVGNTIAFSPSEGLFLTILKRDNDIILQKIAIICTSREEATQPGVLLAMVNRLVAESALPLPKACLLQGIPPQGVSFPHTELVDFFKAVMEAYPTNAELNAVLYGALQHAKKHPAEQKSVARPSYSSTHVAKRLSYDFSRRPSEPLSILTPLEEESEDSSLAEALEMSYVCQSMAAPFLVDSESEENTLIPLR